MVVKFQPISSDSQRKYTMATVTNILINKRLFAMFFLGFASGLPLALSSSTLQAWFSQANLSLATIGVLSLLGLPYTLKFIWAPLLDHVELPWLGKRRGWIVLTQCALALAIYALANLNPSSQTLPMVAVAMLVSFFSASQDVAIDGYRTDVLHAEERGLGASYFIFAYRMAMLVAGGLALIFADHLGWKLTYEIMAVIILLSVIPATLAPKTKAYQATPNLLLTIKASLNDFLQRDRVSLLVLFIIFYKFGDALALSLMINFLLNGLGFTLSEVGVAYKVTSIIATIAGAFMGGLLLMRWNIYRALLIFGLAQSFSNLTFVGLALFNKSFSLMTLSIFIENFCSGLSTAAFLAFLMTLCNQRFSASQFALLSAIASIGRVFSGPLAGVLVQHLGWTQFFMVAFVACFPGIMLLLLLKSEVSTYAHAVAD